MGRERRECGEEVTGWRRELWLIVCLLPRLLDMDSTLTSTRGPGLAGKNPVSGLWDRKTANLGVVSIPISWSRERRDFVWHDRYKARIGDYVVQRVLLQFSVAFTVEMKNGTFVLSEKLLIATLVWVLNSRFPYKILHFALGLCWLVCYSGY
jgi:hypothetical protein